MKVLIVSVGVGKGIESGIQRSIEEHNPDQVLFVASEGSTATLDREINGTKLRKLRKSRCVVVPEPENIESAYTTTNEAIQELLKRGIKTSEIFVDLTTGTKTMSAALGILASLYPLASITYVSGTRDKDGKVIVGTERLVSLRPAQITFDIVRQRDLASYFNSYQFNACLKLIHKLEENSGADRTQREELENLESLVRGMISWEMLEHEKAMKYLLKVHGYDLATLNAFLKEMKDELAILWGRYPNRKGMVPTVCKILDLIANAGRRAEEGFYDDAVGRMYRTLEMVSQYSLLTKYAQDTSNINLSKVAHLLSPEQIQDYERMKDGEGKVKLSLAQSYHFLNLIEDQDLGPLFQKELDEFKICMQFRNSSILAHGFAPVTEEQYFRIRDLVLLMAEKIIPDVRTRVQLLRFPRLGADIS